MENKQKRQQERTVGKSSKEKDMRKEPQEKATGKRQAERTAGKGSKGKDRRRELQEKAAREWQAERTAGKPELELRKGADLWQKTSCR